MKKFISSILCAIMLTLAIVGLPNTGNGLEPVPEIGTHTDWEDNVIKD